MEGGRELGKDELLPQMNRMLELFKEPEIALIHVLDLLGSFLGMDLTLVSSSLL